MIEITSLGHSGIRIRGKKVSIVCDPPDGEILGIKTAKKTTADIVLLSQKEVPAHSNLDLVEAANGQLFQISGPGEYEVTQTEIAGIPANSKGSCPVNGKKAESDSTKLTIYQILIDGVNIVFLGTVSKLPQNLVEQLSSVDVLFIPVGGKVSIEPKEASNVITTLEPKIVVPIHYSDNEKDGLKTVNQFLEQEGKIPQETVEKLQITKEKLPEEVKIVILKTE